MTTFITGGTSSIGRVLIKDLAACGVKLRVLVRPTSDRRGLELPGVEFLHGDVTDAEAVRRGMESCDQVCHLAAVVGYHVPASEWWRVNRDGTRSVLEAAFVSGIPSMVQVSTLSVLGPTRPGEVGDERHLPDPRTYLNLYQKTKRAGDDLAREFAAQGLNVKIVYPAIGYGHSWASSHASLQEQTLLRMARGQPVAVLGSGKNKICLAYYRDTVQGIRCAHARGRRGQDYVLGGDNLTFEEILRTVAEILGRKPPRLHIPLGLLKLVATIIGRVRGRPLFPPDFLGMIGLNWNYTSGKAECELGWKPHSFHDGMAETWAAYHAAGREPQNKG